MYEAGLSVELRLNGLDMHRQAEFPIYSKGIASKVKHRMNIVVQDPEIGFLVCEFKDLERVGDKQHTQLWSYMKLLNIHLNMLINFSHK